MLRHIAPAGAPFALTDLARWAGQMTHRKQAAEQLRVAIRQQFGVRHATLTSTGRAGLTVLLKALRAVGPSGRDEVVIPSYTCFSVAASIVKSGLRPRVVDVSPSTLDYAPAGLRNADFTRVLAVMATNLYGLPNDVLSIATVARQHGAFVIDDAAQAMGAKVRGRLSGTTGDAGLFSFDKGKNVSAIDGGVILTDSPDLAAALDDEAARLSTPTAAHSVVAIFKALAYAAFLRPQLYWIPSGVPGLGLGTTKFTTDFPLEQPVCSLTALAVVMLGRLDAFTQQRVANATRILRSLAGLPGVQMISPIAGAAPVYLRLPVLIGDGRARDHALRHLTSAGIGASRSYPTSIADVPELRRLLANPHVDSPGGRSVANRIVTLPTHPFVGPADIKRLVSGLQFVLAGAAAPKADPSADNPGKSAICAE